MSAAATCASTSASKYTEAALDWVITFITDNEVRAKFLQVSSVPAYDPLPIVEASPEAPRRRSR